MNLTLIGYRATGKTTLARLLAERLGWDWIDADVEIERVAGKTIARIFAEDGEPAFRDIEAGVIAELAGRPNLVIAAGGGAPSVRKLWPQPHSDEALGFLTLNPPPMRFSTKSTSQPLRSGQLRWSTTTLTPFDSNTLSPSRRLSSIFIPYW